MVTQERHPTFDALELFAAAALECAGARAVTTHLERCPACRAAARAAGEDMARFRAVVFARTVERVERAVAELG